MIPIFWNYLLKAYFKVFFLCVGGFVFLLSVTRLKEIAHFASISPHLDTTLLFTAYQIPYILPIAIPISCLIAAILLFQKLSRNHELTALRASGLSLKTLFIPIVFSSILLSFGHFFILSEVTSFSYLKSKELLRKQLFSQPFCLLETRPFFKNQNAYLDYSVFKNGSTIKDVLLILPHQNKLQLLSIPKITIKDETLSAYNLAFLSYLKNASESFDPLILENENSLITQTSIFPELLAPNNAKGYLNHNHLPFNMLCQEAKQQNHKSFALTELLSRFSLAFSVFSLTFLGCSLGIEINRSQSKKGLIRASLCALLIFLGFIIAKSLHQHLLCSIFLYLLPQLFVILFSLYSLRKISKGIV